MNKIKIGQSELEVESFCLGGNVFGWTLDEKRSFEILDAYAEAGYNFIDTADSYSHWANNGVGGQSETIIGKWMKLRKNRHQMIIATKVGSGIGQLPNDVSRKHILEAVDDSLKRLQTDCIDLYYLHHDDEVTPVKETLETFGELIKAGKVRAIAASNLSPERLNESIETSEKYGLPKYQALQTLYNLVERSGFENNYEPIAKRYGLTVFPYYALASGFLSGKYRIEADLGKSKRGHDAAKYLNKKGLKIIKALDEIAENHNTVPATVALAWLYSNPIVGSPVSSATTAAQLKQILSSNLLKLDASELDLLNKASS